MTQPASRWVLATSNRGKAAELSALLASAGVSLQVTAQAEFGVCSPPETGATFVENALLKARHAAFSTGLPAIADDSGLVVPALGGAPGVHSARYAGEAAGDRANIAKLLAALATPALERSAKFYCALAALRSADDPAPLIAMGAWAGTIAPEPRGIGGFGYDPVFYLAELQCTAAELALEQKNRMSHRGKALRQLVDLLENR